MSFRSNLAVFTPGTRKIPFRTPVRKEIFFVPGENDAARRTNRFEYRLTTAGLKTLLPHEK